MSSSFGKNIKISIFGESHGKAVGVTMDGIPAGESVDFNKLQSFLKRRAPKQNVYSTPRKEPDTLEFLSGFKNKITCGSPICIIVKNKNQKSEDYEKLSNIPRPGHVDYPASVKYKEFYDRNGSGHFSGRLTVPICIAGGICKQILERKNIYIGAHISSIKRICDDKFNPVSLSKNILQSLSCKEFPLIRDDVIDDMECEILKAKKAEDSVGGTIECAILGVPVGLGEPMFDGIENKISRAVFAIPAIKGIEFGAGFKVSEIYGSENNDEYFLDIKTIKTATNNSGGILGGLSNGMPIIFRVAVKPAPSIKKEQTSLNLKTMKSEKIKIEGRHDSCIVPRVVPCVEAVAATVILDLMLGEKTYAN